jgi:predicted NodU family carbamoyl transferase
LREAGLSLADITHVVFYDKPLIKFERLLETYLAYAPAGFRSFHQSDSCLAERKTVLEKNPAPRIGRTRRHERKQNCRR